MPPQEEGSRKPETPYVLQFNQLQRLAFRSNWVIEEAFLRWSTTLKILKNWKFFIYVQHMTRGNKSNKSSI